MKRRDFLGKVVWTLAALGISEAGWLRLGDRYSQALAQSTARKLALLVGINQYPNTQALSGCLTDVELQRELLIHRFGFEADDILTLTEAQATRQQIETAFLEHLTKQAKPGDVVVFHFSGYGRRLQVSEEQKDREAEESLNPNSPVYPISSSFQHTINSLVPVDDVGQTSESPAVNDLSEETLWLMLRSLPTDHVTTILDTSFNLPSTPLQGSLRIRSHPQALQGQLSAAELNFQQQLRQKSTLKVQKNKTPGVILAAAGSNKLATEAQWAGFDAGLFTYILTQYLWEATPATTVQVSLSRVTGVVEQLVGKEQQPQMSGPKNLQQSELAYYLMPENNVGADGVVTAVEDDGKTARLWLAGLPPTVLEYYGASRLTVVNPIKHEELEANGKAHEEESSLSPLASPLQLQVRSRKGLKAKAQIASNDSTNSLQVGQLVQESVRVLPRNINLNIAFDPNLERIERVDATSAFATIPHISAVSAGEQPVDYIFGRVQNENQQMPATSSNGSPSRYGLFSLGQRLIPNTAGEEGEAVKMAVRRLTPNLQTLLAAKLWRLTANEGSSRLRVKATLEIVDPKERVLMQRETMRQPVPTTVRQGLSNIPMLKQKIQSNSSPLIPDTTVGIPVLPIGSRIQYRVHNDSDRPIYVFLLGLDSSQSAIALYPTKPTPVTESSSTKPTLEDVVIAPGETLTLPQPSVDFEWVIHGPAGLAETQVICSTASFSQTLAALEVAVQPQGKQEQIGTLSNPLEVAQALLQDLHNASAIATPGTAKESTNSTTDTYSLDVNDWASLSFIYQVV